MHANVFALVACAFLAATTSASGTGRSLHQVTATSVTSAGPPPVPTSLASAPAVERGTGSAVAVADGENGANVTAGTVVMASDGGNATGITVVSGTGDVEVAEFLMVEANASVPEATVAVFVQKVEDGVSLKVIQEEFIVELEAAEPDDFVNIIAIGLSQDGDLPDITRNVTLTLLESLGCEEFRKPFVGFTLPIIDIDGGVSPEVNECIFSPCPEECCTNDAKEDVVCGCSATDDSCPWVRNIFAVLGAEPFFWECEDCGLSVDACIC